MCRVDVREMFADTLFGQSASVLRSMSVENKYLFRSSYEIYYVLLAMLKTKETRREKSYARSTGKQHLLFQFSQNLL